VWGGRFGPPLSGGVCPLRHLAPIHTMTIPVMTILVMMIGVMIRYRHLRSHQYAHRPEKIVQCGPKTEVSIHKRQFRSRQSGATRDQDHGNIRDQKLDFPG
jgi:hypothetical protein